jgi:hypothetical protein
MQCSCWQRCCGQVLGVCCWDASISDGEVGRHHGTGHARRYLQAYRAASAWQCRQVRLIRGAENAFLDQFGIYPSVHPCVTVLPRQARDKHGSLVYANAREHSIDLNEGEWRRFRRMRLSDTRLSVSICRIRRISTSLLLVRPT